MNEFCCDECPARIDDAHDIESIITDADGLVDRVLCARCRERLGIEQQQLVARIKRRSKYWGQTPANQWFDVRVVDDHYHLRGNNNNYRLDDVTLGMRLANGAVVDLVSGKVGERP